jgi:hypothetical protein
MKNQKIKTTVLSALCLAAAGFSGISWGHTVSPGQSLGSTSILNADVYSVSCFTNDGLVPKRFVGQVTKTGAATNQMRISIGRLSTVATGASATTTTTAGSSSAFAQVAAVNGSQHIAVIGQSSAVANTYTADLRCETPAVGALPTPSSSGIEAGTTIAGGTLTGGGNPIINQ